MKNPQSKSNQSYLCSNFWQLLSSKNQKFTQRSFYLYTDAKIIKVPGIFGIGKTLKIHLCNVKEIREGLKTDNWREFKYRQKEESTLSPNFHHFSIIIRKSSIEMFKLGCSLDLMTDKYDDYQLWVETLQKLIFQLSEKSTTIYHNPIIWDANNNVINSKFEDFLMDSKSFLESIFIKYSISQTNFMDASGLQMFFKTEQQEYRGLEECSQFISYYNQTVHKGYEIINQTLTESYLSRRAFYQLFESDQFTLFDNRHRRVCQDMSQPLSHYFIASSHNSYLSGNQMTSASSYEMYREILLNGCRCIEVDVWEDENELVVYHGMTMTSKIILRGVLETINESAFVKSEYPVIISIENRCKKVDSQYRMAQMIREIFKDKLYIEPVDKEETALPSPEEMKGKIFIKGIENESSDSESDVEFEFESDTSKNETTVLNCFDFNLLNLFKTQSRTLERRNRAKNISPQQSIIDGDFDYSFIDNETDQQLKRKLQQRRRRSSKKLVNPHEISRPESLLFINLQRYNSEEIVHIEEIFSKCSFSEELNSNPKFSKLITYFKPRKFVSIDDCLTNFHFTEMISRNELASRQLIRESLYEYRLFSSTHMVRVYPHAWRQDSSNYIPTDHWNAGVQMVALNYQQRSIPMLANFALFAQNGKCGYVLKPEYLRRPQAEEHIQTKAILKIRVLCGQFWKVFEKKDTCLKVTIRVYSSLDKHRKSTKCVEKNDGNPIWNEEFAFKLKNPEVSFVQFLLVNKNTFVGHCLLIFNAMKKGYRHISLYGRDMKQIKCSQLFLHVDYFDTREK